nr:SWI/SNF complex subunit SWI3C like [Tanacetum cinerariifolium]
MGYTRRLAQLIRPRTTTSSLASIINPPTIPRTFEPLMKCYQSPASANWKSYLQRCIRITKSYNLGCEFSTGRVLGVSAVLGSFFLRPRFAHCIDGYASSVDDRSMDVFGKSEADDNPHNAMIFVKRLLVPIALLWLVWTHWDYPIFLGVKVLLALLTTKPSHYSVYVFIEQLQKQYRSEHPILHKFKSLHAQKLEVEDYSVFCIAKVEIGEQKYTLLGIMGGWWVLQMSFESALSGFKRRTLELLETAVSSVV